MLYTRLYQALNETIVDIDAIVSGRAEMLSCEIAKCLPLTLEVLNRGRCRTSSVIVLSWSQYYESEPAGIMDGGNLSLLFEAGLQLMPDVHRAEVLTYKERIVDNRGETTDDHDQQSRQELNAFFLRWLTSMSELHGEDESRVHAEPPSVSIERRMPGVSGTELFDTGRPATGARKHDTIILSSGGRLDADST